jgi:hypothetical protein
MTGQMCWLNRFGSETKILHLRLHPHDPWKPHMAMSHLSVGNYNVPGGSEGMATYHILHKAGWKLIATKDAHRVTTEIPQPSAIQH